jgi:hypothetical protein
MKGRFCATFIYFFGLFLGSTAFAQNPVSDNTTAAMSGQDSSAAVSGAMNRELYTVEQEVNLLKERVFRSKATLQLLKELVIEGATIGAQVSIWHVNKMGPAYKIESIQYFLDGKAIYNETNTESGLNALKEVELHQQTLPPGTHNLQVSLFLRGNGLGIFKYLSAYSFRVQSSYTFEVEEGKIMTVRVVTDEKGGLLKPFVERPDVEYEDTVDELRAIE